jgi:hypothetical protein
MSISTLQAGIDTMNSEMSPADQLAALRSLNANAADELDMLRQQLKVYQTAKIYCIMCRGNFTGSQPFTGQSATGERCTILASSFDKDEAEKLRESIHLGPAWGEAVMWVESCVMGAEPQNLDAV